MKCRHPEKKLGDCLVGTTFVCWDMMPATRDRSRGLPCFNFCNAFKFYYVGSYSTRNLCRLSNVLGFKAKALRLAAVRNPASWQARAEARKLKHMKNDEGFKEKTCRHRWSLFLPQCFVKPNGGLRCPRFKV